MDNRKETQSSMTWSSSTSAPPPQQGPADILELFDQNVVAKILRTAIKGLEDGNNPPTAYPEYVPQTGPERGRYHLREASFWTCGFFPGSIYALVERLTLYPGSISISLPGRHSLAATASSEGSRSNGPSDAPGATTAGAVCPNGINASDSRSHDGPRNANLQALLSQLSSLGECWTLPLYESASRTDTHDMGFMIQPSLRRRWELFNHAPSLSAVITAAQSLYSRYDPRVGAIRSWDVLMQDGVRIDDMEEDFLVIVDSMCNLDLLFYAAAYLGDDRPGSAGGNAADGPELREAAVRHAKVVKYTLLREEKRPSSSPSSASSAPSASSATVPGSTPFYSSAHVANFHPPTASLKSLRTAQGYSPASTWARGQAWGILGFSQTYAWTKDPEFLDAAAGMAEYFIHRLESAPSSVDVERVVAPASASASASASAAAAAQTQAPPRKRPSGGEAKEAAGKAEAARKCGRLVPLWDFDAPLTFTSPPSSSSSSSAPSSPLRDCSAGVIAANGMLVLSSALSGLGRHSHAARYLDYALRIVEDTIAFSLAEEKAVLKSGGGGAGEDGFGVVDANEGSTFEAILKNATANHNAKDYKRYWDHGLVYADYYLIEFGNRLLKMGLA
ncbi:uncharacterized protein MKZ38_008871 [Zalerion maritima]|uniref:Unsaturated glucuronyl hydrolase n=1 Tax=Zalerion maritima TaxID=339359 RepID=A0AAD5RVC6_9PEZI|nr:uncharacterized protein MKZ38_008871 [Zalerion maritima]